VHRGVGDQPAEPVRDFRRAASAATSYLHGKQPTPAVLAQAQLHSHATAYWWSAGLFLAGAIMALLLGGKGSVTTSADAQAIHT
jgi:hypothetical protein